MVVVIVIIVYLFLPVSSQIYTLHVKNGCFCGHRCR